MATREQLRAQVQRLLSDTDGSLYNQDLYNDGIAAALEAILPWVFKNAQETLAGNETLTEFELPDGLYRITGVLDETNGIFIPASNLSAYTSPGSNIQVNNDWVEYPEGSISFAVAPIGNIILYYGAVWEQPEDDEDEIEAPDWIERALAFYTASYVLLSPASSASNIRQWNLNIDSGTPVMNPMRDMSTYFMERFRIEMERMPSRIRGARG